MSDVTILIMCGDKRLRSKGSRIVKEMTGEEHYYRPFTFGGFANVKTALAQLQDLHAIARSQNLVVKNIIGAIHDDCAYCRTFFKKMPENAKFRALPKICAAAKRLFPNASLHLVHQTLDAKGRWNTKNLDCDTYTSQPKLKKLQRVRAKATIV